MLVVPLEKDNIHTKDGVSYKVVSFTNYKEIGPAVYAKMKGSKEIAVVYFSDIDTINKTKVEYNKSSKVFQALGKVHRKFQLPQPDDKILFPEKYSYGKSQDDETLEVESLKLKSKSLGLNKGMFIKANDGNYYRMKDILNLTPSLGGPSFNKEEFLEYYKDYIGV